MTDLPIGWYVQSLGKVADTQLGKMLNSKKQTGTAKMKYLRNVNLRWGAFDLSDVKEMDIFEHEVDQFTLRPDDLLVCEGGEPGRCAVWRQAERMAFQNAMHRVRPHPGTSPEFLALQIEARVKNGEFDHLFSGVTIKHFSQQKLRSVEVAIPPLAEQNRIVEILEEQFSRLDSALASVRAVREKAAAFRSSLLHAAFNGGFGLFDEATEWLIIAECVDRKADITDGPFGSNLKSMHYVSSGPRVVRLANIGNGVFLDVRSHITREHFITLRKHEVQAGDVLVASLGENIPRSCVAPNCLGEAIVKADCIRIRPSARISPKYLSLAINSPQIRRQALERVQGVTRPRINLASLKALRLPVPSLEIQERIVAILEEQFSRLDNALEIANQLEARIASERRSLLHAAFTGELTAKWRESHV